MNTRLEELRSNRRIRKARSMLSRAIEHFLYQHLPEIQIKLRSRLFPKLVELASKNELAPETFFEEAPALQTLSIVLLFQLAIREMRSQSTLLQSDFHRFRQDFSHAKDAHSANDILVNYLKSMGATKSSLRSDIRALHRNFGVDAVAERVGERCAMLNSLIELSISSMGPAIQSSMADATPRVRIEAENRLRSAYLAPLFLSLLEKATRWPLKLVAARSLSQLYGALVDARPTTKDIQLLSARVSDTDEHPWVRYHCFDALTIVDANSAIQIRNQLHFSTSTERGTKDFLLRRLLIDSCPSHGFLESPGDFILRCVESNDPSEHVRLGLCLAIPKIIISSPQLLHQLRILAGVGPEPHEKVPKVHAQAVKSIAQIIRKIADDKSTLDSLHDSNPKLIREATTIMTELLISRTDSFVMVTACQEVALCISTIVEKNLHRHFAQVLAPWVSALTLLRGRNEYPSYVQEQAGASLESIVRDFDETRQLWTQRLDALCQSIPPGSNKSITIDALDRPCLCQPHFVGRILAELSRRDWGLYADIGEKKLTIYRGERFRIRLWRVFHEIRNHAPNKRQGFQHSIGRVFRGCIRAHPGRMDEVTPTVVPGERVTIDGDGSWGRHMPLIDDLLGYPYPTANRPVAIYSSQGVTEVWFSGSPAKIFFSRLRIGFSYERLAKLRNQCLASNEAQERSEYLRVLHLDFGVHVHFSQHPAPGNSTETEVPDQIATLFAPPPLISPKIKTQHAASWIPIFEALGEWFDHHAHYFLTLSGNDQSSLGFFCVAMMAYFLFDGFRRKLKLEQAKSRIPFTIGGWGTRGKSGTERLKAGIFHGLGYRVFSKTTGCEAMFIHSVSDGPAVEIYAFRPYGKATIWEQRDLVELAANLDSDVFLWECMALNPGYVDILQNSWMKDSLVTLTNAYPDHEDIQGPAGINVAEVISKFAPNRAKVFSSEINFLPILRDATVRNNSTFVPIPEDAGDLIGNDLLDLFPYQEHPRNIALVATMAEELGIDRNLAILTMAENVVPDLGVLKVYPDVRVRGRTLRFINGCSANERTGFINNWRRTKCDQNNADLEPHRLIMTVVNNRDDRVSRSEVFSRILVNDTATDRHLLVGTNLRGLVGYIHDALEDFLDSQVVLSARDFDNPNSAPIERLQKLMNRLRTPTPNWKNLHERLSRYANAMGVNIDPDLLADLKTSCEPYLVEAANKSFSMDSILEALKRDARFQKQLQLCLDRGTEAEKAHLEPPETLKPPDQSEVAEHFINQFAKIIVYCRLLATLKDIIHRSDKTAIASFHVNLRSAYRELFLSQIHVVENPLVSGDQIVDECARGLPPGTDITIMGTQNIKGTGLDFAYRWIAIDAVTAQIDQLSHPDSSTRLSALTRLEAFEDHGLVDIGMLKAAMERWKPDDQEESVLHERLIKKSKAIHKEKIQALISTTTSVDFLSKFLFWVEAWVEFLDGAYRFHFSRRLMADLARKQISHERAAIEMRNIYARTKGGWLKKMFMSKKH